MIRRYFLPLVLSFACSFLSSSCSLVRSVPIPFMGGEGDRSTAEDPQIGFTQSSVLKSGHTLDVSVYQGLRSPSRTYHDTVVVDENGQVDLGSVGKAKVGGLTALNATKSIEGAFRTRAGTDIIQVQIKSIEDVPTLTVDGAVKNPAVIQWFSGATLNSVLSYVGGRDLKSSGRAVYVTHKGKRKFLADSTGHDEDIELEPGDIVFFSGDL